ncbi:histidinol-phosphate transaminase [Mesorhizobium sp. M0615]|uniref:histidinol-phosphate transaminase n=1 Tax=unclassified Mesorhizobium TaxID=325217 RepID=UPI0003CFFE6D|nr:MULTISPECIES: histidinol-phosphate transaminase [unclassified Mesorhizobium]ESZ56140.1 histidinol-phosphate aminotransferase [Mesorhizobium sp. L103C120A0]ESZ71216.1 histidinol-phosphate aminotransferase [Mesorhizobium sp. L103C105A0]WJI44856.1 histidinol-phosphate transaminase [Mesorhizobium sp. C120A]
MSDAKLQTVLSALSQVTRQLDALPSNGPAPDANFIKLNTNENPFPLPPIIMQSAVAALKRQYLYPDDDNFRLREAASSAYGVSRDQVIAGNGSSELLGLIYRAFLAPGDKVAMMSPGFSFNRKLAMLQGAEFLEIGCQAHSLPMEQLLSGPAKDAKFIMLANPNNPTGTFLPISDIERLVAQSDRLIVLDEAYVDFAPDHGLRLINRYSNLLILRSFSKSYAAAGIRVGFGFGHPEIIGRLRNIQNVFNMNVIGHAVGISVLAHRGAYADNHKHIKDERERVTVALSQLGFSVTPSRANFLLARVPAGQDGSWWQAALERQKILVAFFPDKGLEHCIRVSIGTKEQMDEFLAAAGDIAGSLTVPSSRGREASGSASSLR